MLWKVQISLRQKLALGGIFLLTVVIMIFAVLRAVLVTSATNRIDPIWLYLWSYIEQIVGKPRPVFPS